MQPHSTCGFRSINLTGAGLQEHSTAEVATIDFKELEKKIQPVAHRWQDIALFLDVKLYQVEQIRAGLPVRGSLDYWSTAVQRALQQWISEAADNEVDLGRLVSACASSYGGRSPALAKKLAEEYGLVHQDPGKPSKHVYEPFKVKINLPEMEVQATESIHVKALEKKVEELSGENVLMRQRIEELEQQTVKMAGQIAALELSASTRVGQV